MLQNKQAAFPEAGFEEETEEIDDLKLRLSPESTFVAFEAMVFGQEISESARLDIQNLILPRVVKYFDSLANQKLSLQQAETASLRALLFSQYYSLLPHVEPHESCLSQLIKSRQYEEGGKQKVKFSLDILLDLEKKLEKEQVRQVLETFPRYATDLYQVTQLPLSLRIFRALANLDLDYLRRQKRLLKKISTLDPKLVEELLRDKYKLSQDTAKIEEFWERLNQALQINLLEWYSLTQKNPMFRGSLSTSLDFNKILKNLSFLLSRQGSDSVLKMQISQLTSIISRHFNEKLRFIQEIQNQEEMEEEQPSKLTQDQMAIVVKQFRQSKSILVQIWKILESCNFKSEKIRQDLQKWVDFYTSSLNQQNASLSQRLYPVQILVDLKIKDHQFYSQYFQEMTELTLFQIQSMASLLDSSLTLLEYDTTERELDLDFIFSKYLKKPQLYRQLMPQYSQTLSLIVGYFKFLNCKTIYTAAEMEHTLQFLDLIISGKESFELVMQALLTSLDNYEVGVKVQESLIKLRDSFLKNKEDEFFSSMSPHRSFLTSLFKQKEEKKEQESRTSVTVQGINALISEIQFMQDYISLLLSFPSEAKHLISKLPKTIEKLEYKLEGILSDLQVSENIQRILFMKNENPLFDQFQERSDFQYLERNLQILTSKTVQELLRNAP